MFGLVSRNITGARPAHLIVDFYCHDIVGDRCGVFIRQSWFDLTEAEARSLTALKNDDFLNIDAALARPCHNDGDYIIDRAHILQMSVHSAGVVQARLFVQGVERLDDPRGGYNSFRPVAPAVDDEWMTVAQGKRRVGVFEIYAPGEGIQKVVLESTDRLVRQTDGKFQVINPDAQCSRIAREFTSRQSVLALT